MSTATNAKLISAYRIPERSLPLHEIPGTKARGAIGYKLDNHAGSDAFMSERIDKNEAAGDAISTIAVVEERG